MQERTFELATASGTMEVFVSHPDGPGPFPAVILYMDMWGIREELRDLARRVATSGYYCVLPDLYYRWGKIRNSFKNEQGQMLSFANLDPARQEVVLSAMKRLSDAMVIDDTRDLLGVIDADVLAKRGPVLRAWRLHLDEPLPLLSDDGHETAFRLADGTEISVARD